MFVVNYTKLIGIVAGLLVALGVWGCDSQPQVTVVDFSRTVQAPQPDPVSGERKVLRVAIGAMISPKETFIYYRRLLDYLGRTLGVEIEFTQRKTYQEINHLFETGDVDLGFICSGPYALNGRRLGMKLIGAPLVRGKSGYQAYLIVNSGSKYADLSDLKGKVFAFTDPDSNTGHLVPLTWLHRLGHTPDTFFKESLFTYSHDNSILAVSRDLVDGATVDGLIWEYYRSTQPALTNKTRVIVKSEYFGMPPVVVRQSLPATTRKRLAKTILDMHNSEQGKAILDDLLIEKFVEVEEEDYSSIRDMKALFDARAEQS